MPVDLLLQHTQDEHELQTISHHMYCYVGTVRFINQKEKTRYLTCMTAWAQPKLISTSAFNKFLVDVARPIPTDLQNAYLYRATNSPHPKLGEYVLVY